MPRRPAGLRCTSAFQSILEGTRVAGSGAPYPVADIVVRNWGLLVTLIGAMLIYGAFNPSSR